MPGKFEQADGGTLFLDEIGDMPLDAQTRLLRVLQEGESTRVGGRDADRADVRIVAATNRDLRALIQRGPVPRGPVLPPQRRADPPAAAARAAEDIARPRPRLSCAPTREGLPAQDHRRRTRSTC